MGRSIFEKVIKVLTKVHRLHDMIYELEHGSIGTVTQVLFLCTKCWLILQNNEIF